jgi:hypothetical protein
MYSFYSCKWYVIDHVMRTKSRPNHIFGHLILSFKYIYLKDDNM